MAGSFPEASELDAERAFERALIDSARGDEPSPSATEAAWQRFAASSGAVAGAALGARQPGGARSRFSDGGALGYTALGALGGGALVAAWFSLSPLHSRAPAAAVNAPQATHTAHAAHPAHAATAPVPSATPGPFAPPPAVASAPQAAPARETPAPQRALSRRDAPALPVSPADPGLGAEIALLDAARTAIGIGAFERALALVERHRREHPRGMLRRDAEVLLLEALFERGDRTEASLRAQGFLERYPDDPHSARVREIAGLPSPARGP